MFAYVPLAQDAYYYNYKGSSVVRINPTHNYSSGGTGFQVQAPSGRKYILTNKHICKLRDKFNQLSVQTVEGVRKTLLVLHIYTKHDLCLLEPYKGLRAMKIASNIYRTERVYLIGHPRLYNLTFERGYYRGKKLIRMIGGFYDTFSFNLIAYGGNSGSPIIDVYGNVVSVLFAGSPAYPNFTYGVPLKEIHNFLKDR